MNRTKTAPPMCRPITGQQVRKNMVVTALKGPQYTEGVALIVDEIALPFVHVTSMGSRCGDAIVDLRKHKLARIPLSYAKTVSYERYNSRDPHETWKKMWRDRVKRDKKGRFITTIF